MSIVHDPVRGRQAGLALATVSIVAVVAGVALFVTAGGNLGNSWLAQNGAAGLALAVAFAAMVRRQPNNAAVWVIGWAALILSVGQALLIGVNETALVRLLAEDAVGGREALTYGVLPIWLAWSLTLRDIVWIPAWFSLMTFGLLLFPDGRLVARRWRVVAGATIAGMTGFVVVLVIALRPARRAALPLDAYPMTPGLEVAESISFTVLLGATVASVVSLLVRYRRASGDARRQIRWVAVGGAVVIAAHLLWLVAFIDEALAERLVWLAVLVAVPVMAASYAVAILRYRLYDIDVVLSRSLVGAALAGFIAVVYITVVVGVGRAVGVTDESSLVLKVVATSIVAVAFQPVRQRLRRWADRAVYGHRATPYEVLAGFSRQAASAGDEANLQRIADVLAAGTGAQPATVWLRVGDQLRAAASSDPAAVPDPVCLPADADELPPLPSTLVIAVRHDGDLLGAISLTKPRSEPPTAQDEELAIRLSHGLALMLRNARLTAELHDKLEALQASRARLVRAQDDARRKIEAELRAGAERQLGEVADKLDAARQLAATAQAVRTTTLLEQLEVETDAAVGTLRALASGIYPPTLEAEGLGAAVSAHARTATMAITMHAAGLPRYRPEVEAAVYFSILEALQNAAKYAQASSVHVGLEHRGTHLIFEVSDDGIGFDPRAISDGSGLQGIAARLDTIGGTVEVRSRPGAGTRVIGRVRTSPVEAAASERRAVEVPA